MQCRHRERHTNLAIQTKRLLKVFNMISIPILVNMVKKMIASLEVCCGSAKNSTNPTWTKQKKKLTLER